MKDSISIDVDTTDTTETSLVQTKKKTIKLYGDTIWLKPHGIGTWSDTMVTGDYQAYVFVVVDTTDYIIDTVLSPKGNRLVIGYNHQYNILMQKNNKHLFALKFDKKNDLASLIGQEEMKLESNLDVFKDFMINGLYEKFVFELSINSGFNYSNEYYFIVNNKGKIEYKGRSGISGTEDHESYSLISNDMQLFISSREIYSVSNGKAMPINKFISLAELLARGTEEIEFSSPCAMKLLPDDKFLIVFEGSEDGENALIISTDTLLEGSFTYSGIIEDMETSLLFDSIPGMNKSYLYDIERKKLISITHIDSLEIREISLDEMVKAEGDTMSPDIYKRLYFEAFDSYRFYFPNSDSVIYYDIDRME